MPLSWDHPPFPREAPSLIPSPVPHLRFQPWPPTGFSFLPIPQRLQPRREAIGSSMGTRGGGWPQDSGSRVTGQGVGTAPFKGSNPGGVSQMLVRTCATTWAWSCSSCLRSSSFSSFMRSRSLRSFRKSSSKIFTWGGQAGGPQQGLGASHPTRGLFLGFRETLGYGVFTGC